MASSVILVLLHLSATMLIVQSDLGKSLGHRNSILINPPPSSAPIEIFTVS